MKDTDARTLMIAVFYEGPWAKLSDWCYGLKKDGTLLWDIPLHPRGLWWVLAKLGAWLDDRDRIWRAKYVALRKDPPARWKRRTP